MPSVGWIPHRDATAVVFDANDVVPFQHDVYGVAVASQGFVDRIVHYLIDEMMEALDACGTYVHARALSYRLEPFENLNAIR